MRLNLSEQSRWNELEQNLMEENQEEPYGIDRKQQKVKKQNRLEQHGTKEKRMEQAKPVGLDQDKVKHNRSGWNRLEQVSTEWTRWERF